MRKKYVVLLMGVMVCATLCTGCSSPYLPHNAFKYIPEFQSERNTEKNNEENITEATTEGDEAIMQKEVLAHKAYFSPDSIRNRYAEHIQNVSLDSVDPLLNLARDTVRLMRQDGKTEEEIRTELKAKFHFSEEVIDELVEE